MIRVAFETATNSHEILRDGTVELCFERNWDLYRLLCIGGILRGQSVLVVGSHLSVHTCEDDASTASAWVATHNNLKVFLSEKMETSLHKKISEKKSSCMVQGWSMHGCTG